MALKKLISVVLPVYNEQENISIVYQAVCYQLKKLVAYEYEIIFINDGSTDRSWECLKKIALSDHRVRVFSLSRNFGHQIALCAGYDRARGDCIISMDADMQHPPELIMQMIAKWENGFAVVYAKKVGRKDGFLKRTSAALFYKLLDAVSEIKMPRNVSDFRLIDKKVLSILRTCPERSPYLRGMVAWTGFTHTFVECPYVERFAGTTGYTWKKMFKLALDGLTGFTTFPIKLIAYFGFFFLFIGGLIGFYMTLSVLFAGAHYALSVWLVVGLIMMFGLQSLFIWFIGEYIAKIHEQQKGRPLYVVEDEVDISHMVKMPQAHVSCKKQSKRVVS